jgi:hypothetical protein
VAHMDAHGRKFLAEAGADSAFDANTDNPSIRDRLKSVRVKTQKHRSIYTSNIPSYPFDSDRRPQLPSAENSQEELRRSLESVAEFELTSTRRHLLALIASAPDSKLEQMTQAVERTLAGAEQGRSASNGYVRIAFARAGAGVARRREVTRAANGSTKQSNKKNPSLPGGLRWPKLKYWRAHQRYGWNIVEFLETVWLPIIKAGAVDLHTLRDRDESAAMAISNYTRKDPKTGLRKKLPYNIPTKKEKNDLLLANGLRAALQHSPELGHVIAQRLKRGQVVPGM